MAIYLVQHGMTVPKEADPRRPLSDEGREEILSVAEHLKKMGIAVPQIYHSGKARASETARILSDRIGNGEVHEVTGMNPMDDVTLFTSSVRNDAMYVGHLPHMGKLVSYLITGETENSVVRFIFGGVVCVEKDRQGYHVQWYLRPSMCTDQPHGSSE
ncbi:MAG: phosphohistidine phosphatase SixA [Desulfobacteraceae bacterium]|nr:phosphohistidine phosphatase SixA [Desulfobacteraceae bacterium]